jgi:hypothetical protein
MPRLVVVDILGVGGDLIHLIFYFTTQVQEQPNLKLQITKDWLQMHHVLDSLEVCTEASIEFVLVSHFLRIYSSRDGPISGKIYRQSQ